MAYVNYKNDVCNESGQMPTFFLGERDIMQSLVEKVKHIVLPILEDEGLELFDIELKRGKGRGVLRIFIDKEGGVSIGDCENVSKQISVLLDVEDIITHSYVLEVSSPGLDRPLRNERDFSKFMGRLARVKFKRDFGVGFCIGRITKVAHGVVWIVNEHGAEEQINLADVMKANLEVEF